MAVTVIGNTGTAYQGSAPSNAYKPTQEIHTGEEGGNKTVAHKKEEETIQKAVEQINKKVDNPSIRFAYHEKTNRIVIRIVDRESMEVVKEIPLEKTLDMIAKVWEIAGILVDEKR